MPVNGCCCGGCDCTECPEGLAGTYRIDLSGTWDMDPSCVALGASLFSCSPSDTEFNLEADGGGCAFQRQTIFAGDAGYCVDGKAYRTINLGLSGFADVDGCLRWNVAIEFFDGDGSAGAMVVVYRQRTHTCDDPTGVYDFYVPSGNVCVDPSLVPASITVF